MEVQYFLKRKYAKPAFYPDPRFWAFTLIRKAEKLWYLKFNLEDRAYFREALNNAKRELDLAAERGF